MKAFHFFSVIMLLYLCSCSGTTDSNESFPQDVTNFMLAGNPGTELVMKETYSQTDTTGKESGAQIITSLWTVMERDVLHPIGGKSVAIRTESREANSSTVRIDSLYLSLHDNLLMRFMSMKDTTMIPFLKNPVIVGTQFMMGNAKATVKSVGEIVNTTYKPLKAVLVEAVDTVVSTSSQIKFVFTHRFYLAPEVFIARYEEIRLKIYPDNRTSKETIIGDLVQYSKK
ncbi:MAG: hypothetical protein HYZ54_14425 [Ignavibacteriae bacterium]|nr:hypothetical protein [Ignavibacteriota bacterium]